MRSAILAFVLGVWLLQQMSELPGPWYAAWVFLWLPAWLALARRSHRMRHAVAVAAACCAGFFWAATLAHIRLADALPEAWEGRDIELTGVVAGLPQLHARGERFVFDVERVATPGARVPQRISLTRYFAGAEATPTATPHHQFHAGERWRLTVRLKRPHGTYNPFGMDFEAWALERNIRATGYLRGSGVMTRLQETVWRPSCLVEVLRESVRQRFGQVLGDSRYAGLLLALAIGDDSGIRRDDWQTLLHTGTNHLMSISGLHVTMVASLVFMLFQALWRRHAGLTLRCPARKAATLAGLLAAVAYAVLAGFAVPTQRTLYMLAVIALALWQGRFVPASLILGWALLAVVVIDPWAVISPGFWLSFGAVSLLVYAGSHRIARPHWLREALHAQWVIFAGLTPLLLGLFQQVSLVSPLANAFAIPVVSLLVTPLTLLGAIIPIDGLLQAAHFCMHLCMQLLAWMAEFPAAVWQQHAPLPWTLPLALAGVGWMLAPRGFPLRWTGMLAVAPMLLLKPDLPAAGEMQLTVLDVGQGLAVVVRTARHSLLYDAGSRFSDEADSGNRIILPYLRGAGIAGLDGMIISHDDNDHAGGAKSVIEASPPGWQISSLAPGHALRAAVPDSHACRAGQSWNWDGVRFTILHPDMDAAASADRGDNDRSCVLMIATEHGSALLPGDIERRSELELLQRHSPSLRSDVLLAPHHGSRSSSTADFVEAVKPQFVVFTSGYRNRFRHPHPEVVGRYRDLGSRVLRSDRDGAVFFTFAGGRVTALSWREQRPRYWHARVAETGRSG